MAQFSNSFTGKGIYQPLPSGEGMQRSNERMSDLILQADKLKLDTFKKNEEEFLKASNIDPVFVISQAARETQQKMLDKFNEDWGKKYQQYGGNLPTEEKVRMAKEKDFMMMQQGKMKADMERAMQEREMLSKDIRRELDHEQGNKKWEDYIKTGTYDETPLMPSEIDPDLFFNSLSNKYRGTRSKITKTVKTPDGRVETQVNIASGSEEEARDFVKSHLASNDRFARGVIKRFSDLKTSDPKKYQEYLNSSDNPILKFAQDKYWERALILEKDESDKPATVSTSNKPLFSINIGGDTVQMNAGKERNGSIPYANQVYNRPIDFGGEIVNNIPTSGGKKLSSSVALPVVGAGSIKGALLHYVPDRDVFIIRSTGGSVPTGTLMEIPASNLGNNINTIPIIINGKETTLAELRGAEATSSGTPTLIAKPTTGGKKVYKDGKWVLE